MTLLRHAYMIGIAAAVLWAAAAAAAAAVIDVPSAADLSRAVETARPGDVLRLGEGRYAGPILLDKSLTIEGASADATEIAGNGQGSVIKIVAPGVTVRRVRITGSGTDGGAIDGGIYVELGGDDPVIEDNRVEGNLFGIVLHGCNNARVQRNRIANRNDLWLNNRGNGIHIWNNHGDEIDDNAIYGGRDGIFIQISHGNSIRNNRMEHLRIAIHYMYANRNEIVDNLSVGNHVGFALMYSERLIVRRNVSIRDRDEGLLFHTSHKSEVAGNVIRAAAGKCVFIYTSTHNIIDDNWFEGCDIGIHFTGGSEDNQVYGNVFLDNRNQVKYTGTKIYEWSQGGRGNYWSDSVAVDLDGNGIADTAYRPNSVVDWIVWRYPLAKLLLTSPAMDVLRYSQSQFPTLYPGGVVDSFALIDPPRPPVPLPAVPATVDWVEGPAEPGS